MNQRDLNADLAICNAATAGPWIDNGNEIVTAENRFVGIAGALTDEDNQFIAEARTGWPHAIERALAAERKLAEIDVAYREGTSDYDFAMRVRKILDRDETEATADDTRN